MKKAAFFCIVISSVLTAAGCGFFSSPFEFDNPWDPRYESEGGWTLDGEPFGKLAYEGRTGLPGMSCAEVNPDGGTLYVADRFKKGIFRFGIPGAGSPEELRFQTEEDFGIGSIGDLAVTNINGNDYIYFTDGSYVYWFDTYSRETRQLYDEGRGYSIYFIDFADTDGNVYLLTDGENGHTVRWLDGEDGTELGSFSPPEISEPAGFAVSGSWVFIADKGYGAIFIYNRAADTDGQYVMQGEIYYNGGYQTAELTNPSGSEDPAVRFYDCAWDSNADAVAAFVQNGAVGSPEILSVSVQDDGLPLGPMVLTTQIDLFSLGIPLSFGEEIAFAGTGTAPGYFYLCEPHLESGYIEEIDASGPTNNRLFTNPAKNANEFARVNDFKRDHAGGDLYFLDGALWQWQRYLVDDLSWDTGGHFGIPGTNPGGGDLSYPASIAVNSSYVFVSNGGDAYIRRYTLDGTPDAVYGPNTATVDKIVAFKDDTVLGWSNDYGELYAWDGAGTEFGPFSVDGDVQHADIEKDGNDVNWAAVNFWGGDGQGTSSFGTLNWDAGISDFVYEEKWNSAEEEWFSSNAAYNYTNEPYFIREISVPGNGYVWAYFDKLSAAAKFTTDGELIGTFCLKDSFPGERWLPERFFNFSRSEDGGWDQAELGGIAADQQDTLWVYDNGTNRVKKYVPDFPEETAP
jgi:hypothetical protein